VARVVYERERLVLEDSVPKPFEHGMPNVASVVEKDAPDSVGIQAEEPPDPLSWRDWQGGMMKTWP
jgi:hypothetical protein